MPPSPHSNYLRTAGTGGKPELGEEAAQESHQEIGTAVQGADMVRVWPSLRLCGTHPYKRTCGVQQPAPALRVGSQTTRSGPAIWPFHGQHALWTGFAPALPDPPHIWAGGPPRAA